MSKELPIDRSSDADSESEVIDIEVNPESKLTESNVKENNALLTKEEDAETLEGLSFEEIERAISEFPDLDRTITESDKGAHDGDSWMDVSSIGSPDSASSDLQYPREKSAGEGREDF